ncbi:hypothetical protein [Legionella pneumophila]|nr:hypothetical protein [Legionella pneumophila]HAT4423108.1 hypothetical protein [Legionella pneumophila]HAU1719522.1 hypothetical protein [Legionella pneumophila]
MLTKNLNEALSAIKYVKSKLVYGSNTEKDSKKLNWEPGRIILLRKEVHALAVVYARSHNGKAGFDVISKLTHAALLKYGFGNCGEQAQTAFCYLQSRGVAPLDYCQTSIGEHCLIVIGRVSGSDPNDISTWGEDAVICDPWAEKAYPLSEFRVMQSPDNDIRYPEICYANGKSPKPYLAGELISHHRIEPASKASSLSFFKKESYEHSELNSATPMLIA